MNEFKVRRSKIAVVGAALAMICGVLGVVWVSLAVRGGIETKGIGSYYYRLLLSSEWRYILFFVTGACCVIIFIGGILILRRRYRLGGILVLVPSIYLIVSPVSPWYAGISGIIGGILGLISKEEIPQRVLEIAKQQRQISIKEVANLTGKTELDVEVAIVKLKSKGQPIRFDMKTRNVIYDS